MCDVALLCRCDFVVSVLLLSVLLLLDLRDDDVVADVVVTVCCAVTGVTVTAAGDGDTPFEITSSCVLGGRAGEETRRRWLRVMLIHRN